MFLDRTPLIGKSKEKSRQIKQKSQLIGSKDYKTRKEKLLNVVWQEKEEECWFLHALKDKSREAGNCGTVMWRDKQTNKKTISPTRQAMYEEFVGPIPADHRVMSTCHITACVNPKHLYLEEFGKEFATPEEKAFHMLVQGEPDECWVMRNKSSDKHPYISFTNANGLAGPLSARTLIYKYFKVEPIGHAMIRMECDNLYCVNPGHMRGKLKT